MARRATLKGLACGFLGTYISRYTEYRGYWLFGFLVGGPPLMEIDLRGGVTVAPETSERLAGTNLRTGREMTFVATIMDRSGETFEATRTIFVAEHDPARELRSASYQEIWTARP